MSESWYAVVGPDASLTQGDILLACPLLEWETSGSEAEPSAEGDGPNEPIERLSKLAVAVEADVVVMSQACDLEHGKVSKVVLCPCLPLSKYKADWEAGEKARKQNPSPKAWKRVCGDITEGYIWNLFMMESMPEGELTSEHRIVDFHSVYTIPRAFLDSLIVERGGKRLRLLPPYREHLSQSFARFFMRVGLPENIKPGW
jgi:hypothetical protein